MGAKGSMKGGLEGEGENLIVNCRKLKGITENLI
jgi:hypothetical protein